jgi:hypothetical protein
VNQKSRIIKLTLGSGTRHCYIHADEVKMVAATSTTGCHVLVGSEQLHVNEPLSAVIELLSRVSEGWGNAHSFAPQQKEAS